MLCKTLARTLQTCRYKIIYGWYDWFIGEIIGSNIKVFIYNNLYNVLVMNVRLNSTTHDVKGLVCVASRQWHFDWSCVDFVCSVVIGL